MRRLLCALATTACLAGCGTGTQLFSPSLSHAAWCAYHVSRLAHDVRTHHLGWAAFQAWRSAHNCSRI